jgi:hypothetical protein
VEAGIIKENANALAKTNGNCATASAVVAAGFAETRLIWTP